MMPVQMAAHRMILLPVGMSNLPLALLRRGGSHDEMIDVPIPAFAIETDDGWVLFDTGFNTELYADRIPPAAFQIVVEPEEQLLARLEAIGLRPDDIDHVVVSHMHSDHVGGAVHFPKSKTWLQKDELRWAMHPDHDYGTIVRPSDFDDAGLDFHLVEGDAEVVPGVHVLYTPGHTFGHQSLVVDLPSGRFVLTGDTAYERMNVDRAVPPTPTVDSPAHVRSLTRIAAFETRDDATVIVNHDDKTWKDGKIEVAEYR